MDFQSFLNRLKAASQTLSGQQMATLLIAFVAVVSLTIGAAYYLNTPTYSVLFSDMDSESASSVVTRLKNEKVLYTLDDGGKTVRVPLNRVDELRLEFASQGMPTSGRIGFEIFDRTTFGVTDFLEHVNYRRALEGELARTISTIAEVAGARVHIAMPQPSLFAGRDQPTKASVVLKLKSNRQLQPATVTAITGLISASVESLRPESVVIIDNFGRPLSKPLAGSDDEAEGAPLERQQRIERDSTTHVVALLEPIVGPGRVRVNVSAQLATHSQEETEEKWDPTPVVRSHQTVSQNSAGGAPEAVGVAGARGNLPTPPTAAAAAPTATVSTAQAGASHLAETTNYEVSKVTRHTVQPRGDIARLSVAVVLDDERPVATAGAAPAAAKPRAQADIQKIQGLVAAAVGLDTDRGDQLTVENIAFEETPVEEIPVQTAWQRYQAPAFEFGRIAAIVILGLVALLFVIRPMIRSTFAPAGPAALKGGARTPAALTAGGGGGGGPRTVQDMEAELEAQLGSAQGAARLPVLTRRVASMTAKEPENAARLLRTWLTEDER